MVPEFAGKGTVLSPAGLEEALQIASICVPEIRAMVSLRHRVTAICRSNFPMVSFARDSLQLIRTFGRFGDRAICSDNGR